MAAFEIPQPQLQQLNTVATPLNFMSGLQSGIQTVGQINQMRLQNAQAEQQKLLAGLQGQEIEIKKQQMAQEQAQLAAKQEELARQKALEAEKRNAMFADLLAGANPDQVPFLLRGMAAQDSQNPVLQQTVQGLDSGAFTPADVQQEAEKMVIGYMAKDPSFETPRMKREREATAKVQEETRGELRSSVAKLETNAGVIQANYNKLEGLAKRVQGGDRTATSQLLVALVKLGDPGSVVKESEMAAALNTPNPLAYLADKGIQVDQGLMNTVLAKIDPLNPKNVNVDDVLATGATLVASNAPVMVDEYKRLKERGQSTDKAGYQSIFSEGRDKLFGSLSSIGKRKPTAQQNKIEEIRAKLRAAGLTDAQIDERLKGMIQ